MTEKKIKVIFDENKLIVFFYHSKANVEKNKWIIRY